MNKRLHQLTGRADLLGKIDGHISSGDVTVLHGVGGVGKSALAAECARLAVSRGAVVWWISAASLKRLEAGLHSVAYAAGATDEDFDNMHPADVLWSRLDSMTTRWLLVLDNVEDPRDLVTGRHGTPGPGWVRSTDHLDGCSVLITAQDGRQRSWPEWARVVEVDCLKPDQSAELLTTLAPSAGTFEEARKLGGRLGGLPLALDLVGRYLAWMHEAPLASSDAPRTFHQYWERLGAPGGGRLLGEASRAIEEGEVLSRIFELSIDALARQGYTSARDILWLLSCVDASDVPFRAILASSREIDAAGLSNSLLALDGIGLVKLKEDVSYPREPESAPRVHELFGCLADLQPVVHACTRENVEASGSLPMLVDAVSENLWGAIAGLDPTVPDSWRYLSIASAHVDELLSLSDAIRSEHAVAGSLFSIAVHVGWFDYMSGRYVEARERFDRALALAAVTRVQVTPTQLLDARNKAARALRESGNLAGAELELRGIVENARTELGDADTLTLEAGVNLARTLREQASPEQAQILLDDIVRRAPAGSDICLLAVLNIARCWRDRGRYNDARPRYEQALNGWRERHPDSDLTTIDMMYEQAELNRLDGRLATSVWEFTRILDDLSRLYGDEHLNTLIVRVGRAHANIDLGELGAAADDLRAVVELAAPRLGVSHWFVSSARDYLASIAP